MIEIMDSMLDCYQEADWVVWSIDKPAECWEFRSWLRDLAPMPLPAGLLLPLSAVPPHPSRAPREVVQRAAGALGKALASPEQPKRRVRRPTLARQLLQIWKAARAAGIHVAVTVEAGKVTATPVKGNAAADGDFNEWDRELGTGQTEVRQ
jgi:hypothetical protein